MVSVEPGQSLGPGVTQATCSQVRFCHNVVLRLCLWYATGGEPAVFLSFRLEMNGIIPQGKALDPESLKRLPVPRQSRGV